MGTNYYRFKNGNKHLGKRSANRIDGCTFYYAVEPSYINKINRGIYDEYGKKVDIKKVINECIAKDIKFIGRDFV